VKLATHVAAEVVAWHYPGAGEDRPPGGAKCLLLTRHGVCVTGQWSDDGRFLAWAPMPKRNKDKEKTLCVD